MRSSKNCIVLGFVFRFMIHIKLIFCMSCDKGWSSFFSTGILSDWQYLLKSLSLSHWIALAPLSEIKWPCGSISGPLISFCCYSFCLYLDHSLDYSIFIVVLLLVQALQLDSSFSKYILPFYVICIYAFLIVSYYRKAW